MPRRGQHHTVESIERIRQARVRQEARKLSRCGLYAATMPKELGDLVRDVDAVIDAVVENEMGGPGNVRPSQWLLLHQLRAAQVILAATLRHAAARGIVDAETGRLTDCLVRGSAWADRARACLRDLGLVGGDGKPSASVGERLRAIELKAAVRGAAGNGDQ